MPHDVERVAEVREWLTKAEADVRAGEHGLLAEPPFIGDAVFHAQQAAEKALKALLAWHDVPFRKTHEWGVGQHRIATEVRSASAGRTRSQGRGEGHCRSGGVAG